MPADALERFVEAQDPVIDRVCDELRQGRKRSHWMWFVFPQIAGLGRSDTARFYAIFDIVEARAYLAHPLLGPRLVEATEALLTHAGRSAESILGPIDGMKLASSMTLFEAAAGDSARAKPFARCLDLFFAGRRDPATLNRL